MAGANTRKRRADSDVDAITEAPGPAKSRSRTVTRQEAASTKTNSTGKDKEKHKTQRDTGKENAPAAQAQTTKAQSTKREREPEEITTPKRKRANILPLSPAETPTRGASRLFDRLSVESRPTQIISPSAPGAYSSPPLTPSSKPVTITDLPAELQDLVQMFKALLSAYSLYLAHHGVGTPLFLSQLLVSVTSVWKKRKVQDKDIRRLLRVFGARLSPIELVDNRDGNISVEAKDTLGQSIAMQTQSLSREFERLLRHRWTLWCRGDPDARAEVFIDSLPLAEIDVSEVAVDPLRQTKGAHRLHDFQQKAQLAGAALSRKIETVGSTDKTSAAVEKRGESLIDRILAKEKLASAGDQAPTKEALDRIAALDRVEEVALLFGLLAGGRPRASFSMQAIVQHMQSSMRSPIAREEAELCVRVMAEEVCPRYVSVVKTGSVHGVVVARSARPTQAELRLKLRQLRDM